MHLFAENIGHYMHTHLTFLEDKLVIYNMFGFLKKILPFESEVKAAYF